MELPDTASAFGRVDVAALAAAVDAGTSDDTPGHPAASASAGASDGAAMSNGVPTGAAGASPSAPPVRPLRAAATPKKALYRIAVKKDGSWEPGQWTTGTQYDVAPIMDERLDAPRDSQQYIEYVDVRWEFDTDAPYAKNLTAFETLPMLRYLAPLDCGESWFRTDIYPRLRQDYDRLRASLVGATGETLVHKCSIRRKEETAGKAKNKVHSARGGASRAGIHLMQKAQFQRAFQMIVDDGKKPSDFMMVICLLKQEGLLSNSAGAVEQSLTAFLESILQRYEVSFDDDEGNAQTKIVFSTPEYPGNIATVYIDFAVGDLGDYLEAVAGPA
jgi:hypothetical protein